MTKITDKMRRDWLMRKDTEIYQFGLEVSTGCAWAARIVTKEFIHVELGRGRSKETAVSAAIRAEQKSKVKK